jgi:tRNA(Ile)-lysidine synthase
LGSDDRWRPEGDFTAPLWSTECQTQPRPQSVASLSPGNVLLSRVLGTISEHELIARGDRVLIGVSGGPDSMALTHALVRLAPRLGVSLETLTVDHGLRSGSAEEAAEVQRRCAALGLAAHVARVDVAARAARHVSLQDAARRARLAALDEWAAQQGCNRIALGHSADDQAETILFRIVRGTGVDGLKGIPYRREALIRPLLDVRRHQILVFLRRLRVEFVSDPSNLDRRFARSRVRHDWIPQLARENPRLVEALLTLAASARERDRSVAAVPGAPPLGRRAAQVVRRLIARGAGSHDVAVAGGIVEITYGRARFRPPAASVGSATPSIAVAGPGIYRWPRAAGNETTHLVIEIVVVSGADGPPPGAPTFDAEIFSQGLQLRSRRPGDRIRPRGGRGSRKLQDVFVDAKIPRRDRETLPLLVTRAEVVLFVPGVRASEEARPAPQARRWVEIRVR